MTALKKRRKSKPGMLEMVLVATAALLMASGFWYLIYLMIERTAAS